jgi:multidrug efflux pump subunit AcrA (membrane-fusion protein)
MTGACNLRGAAFAAALLAIAAAFASGCGGGAQDEETATTANPILLVTVARAEVQPMQSQLRILGSTVAMRHTVLRAPSAGRVVGINLKTGDVVHRGQVVARVINREIEAARAGLEVASKLDPDEAAALKRSVDRYSKPTGVAVVASEGGVVAQQPVTDGQVVAELDPLVDLIDPSSIYVRADVPIDELHLIKPGMDASVTSPLEPGAKFPARVAAVLPSFDPNSATSPVRLDFIGAERIPQAGAPAEARIVTERVPDALVIAEAALFEDAENGSWHVFVAGADGRAHRTAVTIGIRGADRVQVISGLKPGEQVITSGGYALSDGLQIRIAGTKQ